MFAIRSFKGADAVTPFKTIRARAEKRKGGPRRWPACCRRSPI